MAEETVADSHNQRNDDFELLDSVYLDARHGRIEVFRYHGRAINRILTPNGNTILHIYLTARERRMSEQNTSTDDFVREIVEMCPNLVWQANKQGETLLHFAARHGHADISRFLLQECKKHSQEDHDLESGTETTKLMLKMANGAKDTAFHEAVKYNRLDVVKVLAEEHPDLPYEANSAGETPLYLAAERGLTEVVKKILKICVSPADGGPKGRTALHAAVILNDEEITTLLLEEETLSNIKQDQQGWTPLHLAAHLGYVEILKMLLNKNRYGAYMSDYEGKTALHVAATAGNVDIIRELLNTCPGCSELVDHRGWNALHSSTSDRGATNFLLSSGLFENLINAKDNNGDTPLLLAAKMSDCWDFLMTDKVDQQVFDLQNHNTADIISSKDSKSVSMDSILSNVCHHLLKLNKITPDMRANSISLDLNEANNEEEKTIERSRDRGSRIVESNLLAAILISTVSFTAGVTVPGGFVSDKGPKQGIALLTGDAAFGAFVAFNTMSFLLSSLAVFFHLYESKHSHKTFKHIIGLNGGRYLTMLAMLGMIAAFISGSWAVLEGSEQILAVTVSFLVVTLFSLLICAYNFQSIFYGLAKKLFAPSNNEGNKKM